MTDNEIIKALECCAQPDAICKECPCHDPYLKYPCADQLKWAALVLIEKQKAEIERLIEECGKQSVLWRKHFESIFETAKETTRAEAVKEVVERLMTRAYVPKPYGYGMVVDALEIAHLAEEFKEGNNDE